MGLSASVAFIWLSVFAACAAALALFWLIASITGQERLAAAATIFVLCLGTLVSGHGQVVALFGGKPLYNYLMFLRRYQPSASFPFFFIFCGLVWRALTRERAVAATCAAVSAGAVFALLVFSYFYLWTAAVAWLGCLALLWLWARPEGFRRGLKMLSLTGLLALASLLPYALLLSRRAETMDSVEAYVRSRSPDLFRLPELIAFAVLLVLGLMVQRGAVSWRDKRALFAASFALMPLFVFNQQLVTGRIMQPIHYEMFVANYSALLSVVLCAAMVCQERFAAGIPKRALVWVALAAFEWGAYEAFVAARGSMELNRRLASAGPIAARLAQIAGSEKSLPASRQTILADDLLIADSLPERAPQAVLYAPHMLVYSGVAEREAKERFYQYLYYTGVDERRLEKILTEEGRYGFTAALFGFERAVEGLSDNRRPITREELDQELRLYAEYRASFSRESAAAVKLSYLVLSNDAGVDLTNLDQWYERDNGERIGAFTLYRLKLKDERKAVLARVSYGKSATRL
jgi:hypothetical protein